MRAAIGVRRDCRRGGERLGLDVDDDESAALRPSDDKVAVRQLADGVEVRVFTVRQVDESRRHGVRGRHVDDCEAIVRSAHEDSLSVFARLAFGGIPEPSGEPRRLEVRVLRRPPFPDDLRRLGRDDVRVEHHDARLRLLRAHDERQGGLAAKGLRGTQRNHANSGKSLHGKTSRLFSRRDGRRGYRPGKESVAK